MIFRQPKPSEVLLRLIDGTAGGFELDDLISRKKYGSLTDVFVQPLVEINERYRTSEYPIGISNPESFEDVRALAERLKLLNL